MQTRAKTKSLVELGLTARNASNVRITGLSVDSREVKDGHLFFALPGTNVHGAEFIQYAIRMRAGAVLTDREGASLASDQLDDSDIPLVVVEDPRESLLAVDELLFALRDLGHLRFLQVRHRLGDVVRGQVRVIRNQQLTQVGRQFAFRQILEPGTDFDQLRCTVQ